MKTFVITFSRVGIRDGWVEVQAYSEEIARAWARHEYGQVWSMIYATDKWGTKQKELFPLGCIGTAVLHYQHAEHIA